MLPRCTEPQTLNLVEKFVKYTLLRSLTLLRPTEENIYLEIKLTVIC
jgi:hypothetical protein